MKREKTILPLPEAVRQWTVTAPAPDSGAPTEVWVSVVDRAGNQSTPVRVRERPGS